MGYLDLADEREEREKRRAEKEMRAALRKQSKRDAEERALREKEDTHAYELGVTIAHRAVFRKWRSSRTAESFVLITVGVVIGAAMLFTYAVMVS